MIATCKARVNGHRCVGEKLRTSSGLSIYCYWHRLMRMSMQHQIKAAHARRDAFLASNGGVRLARRHVLDEATERWCQGCQSIVPMFYCTTSSGRVLTRCLACESEARNRSRAATVYGVTKEKLEKTRELQKNLCAGCRHGQRIKHLAHDHNHTTGAWRGLLCQSCNHQVLGGAHDSVRILLNLAYYLQHPPADGDWIPPEELELKLVWRRRDGAHDTESQDAGDAGRTPDPGTAAAAS